MKLLSAALSCREKIHRVYTGLKKGGGIFQEDQSDRTHLQELINSGLYVINMVNDDII